MLNKLFKKRDIHISHKRGTFLFIIDNKSYFIQFSLKEPWFLPKRDTILGGRVTLWGWLFFYIGGDTEDLGTEYVYRDILKNPNNYDIHVKSHSEVLAIREDGLETIIKNYTVDDLKTISKNYKLN